MTFGGPFRLKLFCDTRRDKFFDWGVVHALPTLMDMGFLNSETHSRSVLHPFLVGSLLLLCLLLAEQVLCSAAHIQVSWELVSPVHRQPSPEHASLPWLTPQLQHCLTLGLLRSSLQENLGTPSIALVLIKHMILIPLIILKNFNSFNWDKYAFIPLK